MRLRMTLWRTAVVVGLAALLGWSVVACEEDCSCDGSVACDAGCSCDPDCPCLCDVTWDCDAPCTCDPECLPGGCIADGWCNTSCTTDPDCGACDCNTSTACDSGCACDPDCGGCTCNTSAACESGCACDPDCGGCTSCSEITCDCQFETYRHTECLGDHCFAAADCASYCDARAGSGARIGDACSTRATCYNDTWSFVCLSGRCRAYCYVPSPDCPSPSAPTCTPADDGGLPNDGGCV